MGGTKWMACAALALTMGCGGSSASPDGSIGSDAGVADDDAGPPMGLPLPTPSALPIGSGDVIRVGPGLMLDEGSALGRVGGAITYAFETYARGRVSAELWIGVVDRGHVALPRPQGFTEHLFEASPSFAGDALYFAAAGEFASAPTLYRAVVAAPVALPAVDGLSSLESRPRLRAIPSGVALAFTDDAGHAMLAIGADASSLGAPALIADGALPAVAALGDGSLAYAYHDATNAFVRRSEDGVAWSEPAAVSDAAGAHDVALVEREDGGLDVYYVREQLHRRALAADGSMGPEEQVTSDSIGEPLRPTGIPVDGRVLIAFAEILDAERQALSLASLASEAAAP